MTTCPCADEFEGRQLWFPEFSRRLYKAPTGGAVVFSCSLLHEATPVTRGRRYAFERNRRYLAGGPPVRAGAARAPDGE